MKIFKDKNSDIYIVSEKYRTFFALVLRTGRIRSITERELHLMEELNNVRIRYTNKSQPFECSSNSIEGFFLDMDGFWLHDNNKEIFYVSKTVRLVTIISPNGLSHYNIFNKDIIRLKKSFKRNMTRIGDFTIKTKK
jgi:hypothetical protein